MKKIISLIKVSLNHGMNIFKINTKKQSKFSKVFLPLILTIYIMSILGFYAERLISMLKPVNLEFFVLTFFGLSISLLSLLEGIYKSSTLLFNSNDDNLLLSLPIKKGTILFVRVFKFYVFELLYNSLFLLPAMVIYAINVVPGWTYYLSSFFALLLLPIVPIVLSCILGFIISYFSSKFKGKNVVQTIFTIGLILLIMYFSFNINGFITNIVKKATSINDLITRLYYPVGAYISLINSFSIKTLIVYIITNVTIFLVIIFVLSKLYFRINSNYKRVLITHKNNKYIVKDSSRMKSFIKKEINRFFSTPVFVTNAGLGLVLFVVFCILCILKFDYIVSNIIKVNSDISVEFIKLKFPLILFGFICFTSFMTSITSSMISLEGKSINILKSLPIKPINIVLYKVVTALIIIIPCIIIGDIIIFIKFRFDSINILLILISSILLPIVSELIGIIVNLKYPKLDATSDTEVVKQSMSSMISVFIGMGLIGATILLLFMMLNKGISDTTILLILTLFYTLLALILWLVLIKTCDKSFNDINI